MTKNFSPAISIIIPLYNAEKYIGELLESILAQTFQNFEVLVVDDCSTDNSRAVVENYLPKFTMGGGCGKLKLIKTKKNSGNPATPSNLGIKSSRGKYIFLLDNDDAITRNALEDLYKVAEDFQADVVHCEKYFKVKTTDKIFGRDDYQITSYNTKNFVTEPTLITDNIAERIDALHGKQFIWNLWTKFIRRDFIFEKNLQLLNVAGQDLIFTCCLVCTAKNYVRVPHIVNIWRVVENSLSHKQEDLKKFFCKWTESLFVGIDFLDKFLDKVKFFQDNPQAKYFVFDTLANEFIGFYLRNFYKQIPASQLDGLVREQLKKVKNPTALAAFFFGRMNIFDVKIQKG